jgi:hypothetical protein
MIWGDVVNSVRKLHLHLVQEHGIDAALYTRDIPVSGPAIPFPDSVDDFEEWEEPLLPTELQDLLPLHPVERALIEGRLLPIQIIQFKTPREIESLLSSILALEKDWLEKSGTFTTGRIDSAREFLKAEGLRLIVRAGLRTLVSAKEIKS